MTRAAMAALLLLALSITICAHDGHQHEEKQRRQDKLRDQRPPLLRDVGIDQKLNAQVSKDLTFRDEAGQVVKLGDYLDKPVVLALVYYRCAMLCNLVLDGLARGLAPVKLNAGSEFNVVAISIDPREREDLAVVRKRNYLERYKRPGAERGWHFLTGEEASIRALADSVGFRYAYDESKGEYAHAAGIIVITPEGRVSRYFYGAEYSPRDLRLSLVEASAYRIGSIVDQVLLFCYHYDAATGKYTARVWALLRVVGFGTALVLGGFIFMMLRIERRNNHRDTEVRE